MDSRRCYDFGLTEVTLALQIKIEKAHWSHLTEDSKVKSRFQRSWTKKWKCPYSYESVENVILGFCACSLLLWPFVLLSSFLLNESKKKNIKIQWILFRLEANHSTFRYFSVSHQARWGGIREGEGKKFMAIKKTVYRRNANIETERAFLPLW